MANTQDSLTLKVCGQTKRTRRIKSGLWVNLKGIRVDGRTRTGRWMNFLIGELTKHVGGDPTITQAIVIDGLALKVLRRHFYNTQFFRNKDLGSNAHILALENSIRLDCEALSLKRQEKKVLDLSEYLLKKSKEDNHEK